MAEFLTLDGVTKRYGTATALDRVSIDIAKGDFVTLLGPSGSGKSTALMAIAGFVLPDEGRIVFDGTDISRLVPEKRGFGVVFQGYALFPHMSVAENIAYPLQVRGMARAAIAEKVRRVLDLVQLNAMDDRRPSMLSGGQQQRVAIARALVYEPPILLLDEPLSALDRKLRGELQAGLKALHARLGTTFVNVTHDQDEALGLSTSVAVLSGGRVMQQGSPSAIYDYPETAFVADFIGNANLIEVTQVSCSDGRCAGSAGPHPVTFDQRHPLSSDARCLIAIRQEALRLGRKPWEEANSMPCVIVDFDRVGPNTRAVVDVDGVGILRILAGTSPDGQPRTGERSWVSWTDGDSIHVRR